MLCQTKDDDFVIESSFMFHLIIIDCKNLKTRYYCRTSKLLPSRAKYLFCASYNFTNFKMRRCNFRSREDIKTKRHFKVIENNTLLISSVLTLYFRSQS